MTALLKLRETRPPRLLVVSETLGGGIGAVVAGQVGWFAERGWQVSVAARPDNTAPREAVFHPVDIPTTVRQVAAMRRALRALRHIVNAEAPDIVHCHGLRSFLLARLASRSAPYVTLHGAGALTTDPPGYQVLRRLGRAAIPLLARGAFTAAPEFGGRWRFFAHASPRLREIARHPFPESGPPVFLWVSRLEEPKDPTLFIRALAEVARTQQVRGLVVGSGRQLAALERMAAVEQAPVEFLGHRDDIEALMAAAWAVVLFSGFEGVAFSVQEAMWVGRPVVASPLPGIRWLLGDVGLLAADLQSATDALRRLTSREEASRLGSASAERIRATLDPHAPWPAFEAIYLAGAQPAPG